MFLGDDLGPFVGALAKMMNSKDLIDRIDSVETHSVAQLDDIHRGFKERCLTRYKSLLDEVRKRENRRQNPNTPTKAELEALLQADSYVEVVRAISECGFAPFMEEEVPFCYVIKADPFYKWARLIHDPVDEPNRHYLLQLREKTHRNEIDEMACCTDGRGWTPCPYMLRAWAEQSEALPELVHDNESGVALSVWDALEYLLYDFSEGGDWMDCQLAFEACSYQTRIQRGDIKLTQNRFSGLDKIRRLTALVEYSVAIGFYLEIDEDKLILEHDIALALSAAPGARLNRSSFIAFYASGLQKHTNNEEVLGQSPEVQRH